MLPLGSLERQGAIYNHDMNDDIRSDEEKKGEEGNFIQAWPEQQLK
jgi:hypothetical protein